MSQETVKSPRVEDFSETYKDYHKAILSGNRKRCETIVQNLLRSGFSFMDLYENLFKKSLYEVGDLWERNVVSVAVEHMATLITEDLMAQILPEIISHDRKNKKVVVASIESEEHQVGGKMVADVFEKHGWDAYYLGANTPVTELLHYCEENSPDMIALSLSVYTNMNQFLKEIISIRVLTDTPVLIGGQALRHVGKKLAQQYSQVYYLEDCNALDQFIRNWETRNEQTRT